MMLSALKSCLLVIGVAALVACGGDKPESVQTEPLVKAVKLLEVNVGQQERVRKLTGFVQASELAHLSFQINGKVIAVDVEPGDRVRKDDILAVMDAEPFALKVNTAEAQLARSRAAFEEKQKRYESQKSVFEKQYVSKSAFDLVRAEFEIAASEVKLAESNLHLAKRDLKNTRLRAPFDGEIVTRNVEPFQELATSQTVIEIQGDGNLEVSTLIPAKLMEALSLGSEVRVNIPSAGIKDAAALVVERSIKEASRGAFPIVARLVSPVEGVLSGMSAEIFVTENQQVPSLLLPESALATDQNGKRYTFVFNPQTSLLEKRLISHRFLDAENIEVLDGISGGELVVTAGVEFLHHGQRVKPYEPLSK